MGLKLHHVKALPKVHELENLIVNLKILIT